MARHVVATTGEIAPGSSKLVTVRGRSVALFNRDGEYFAISNTCPHAGGSLCHGALVSLVQSSRPGQYELSRRGEMLQCPWHGWEFDIRTGQSWCDPESFRARAYQVTVEPGETLAKGPYVAETFPVAVEGEYVVVEF
ncbi:Rieske (2Fe-2S) protein [Roseococcus sp. SYP-B2431]|uniref:Rieske (2Fe-2S) protein n=1 Tax=Roseococcus sp. SYP-B2431 TaxID=2496640 RepID=UPI00103CDF14|nr:Rieske (2Fe-2S) protein [Roseococcus sp. SYP-B2431]TCH98332.1 Rieske (2Fe-2S) protein [Roseococcus sp. SYP-B2431]